MSRRGHMGGVSHFHGVYPVVPTPLKEDESLDLAGMEHLVDYYIREGCHGLLVLGSGGESPYFTIDEKIDILNTVSHRVKKSIPVIAGCTFMSLAELVSFFKKADSIDIDGFLVALPVYYPLRFGEVYSFYEELVNHTGKKILYYHFPQITGLSFNAGQMKKLYEIQGIVGAKESSVCVREMKRNLRSISSREFSFFSGTSQLLLTALESGGSGTMCSIPSVAPRIVVDCYKAWTAGDKAGAQQYEHDIFRLIGLMNTFDIPAVVQAKAFKVISHLPFPTGVGKKPRQAVFKETLRQLGHPVTARVRSPLPQITDAERVSIAALIKKSDALKAL